MDTESVGYSRDIVYGQLTMPFVFNPQKVIINAHVQGEEEQTGKAVTKDNFVGVNSPEFRYSVEDIYDMTGAEVVGKDLLHSEKEEKENENKLKTTPSFTASSLSSQDIVNNHIKKGMSPEDSVNVAKAYKAYSNDSILSGKDPIKALGNRSFNAHE